MSSSLLKKILIPLAFIGVLGYFGYSMFIKDPTFSAVAVVEPVSENGMTGDQIVVLINKLKSLSSDQSIFTSETFIRLKDFGTVLVPELQGRSNPFMSIGAETRTTGSVATTSRPR
jgi:hypothetical protein